MDHTPIIVVEDDPVNARLVTAVLQSSGYAVQLVDSGRAFLDRMRSSKYSMAIVDLWLPDTDGSECIRQVRQELGSSVPVLVVSAAAMPEDQSRALAAGATAFLPKPFSVAELIRMVQRLLQQ